ncbi:hypothetical protein J6590_072763 [Homalodisca vitripennis]|nr:hypothetical protein J6590_072763 [Homalodisca vitripennis]
MDPFRELTIDDQCFLSPVDRSTALPGEFPHQEIMLICYSSHFTNGSFRELTRRVGRMADLVDSSRGVPSSFIGRRPLNGTLDYEGSIIKDRMEKRTVIIMAAIVPPLAATERTCIMRNESPPPRAIDTSITRQKK